MYAERISVIVSTDDLIRAQAHAVMAAAHGHDLARGPSLVDEMRVQSWEPVDEEHTRVELVHRDLFSPTAMAGRLQTRDGNDYELREVTSRRTDEPEVMSRSVSEPREVETA